MLPAHTISYSTTPTQVPSTPSSVPTTPSSSTTPKNSNKSSDKEPSRSPNAFFVYRSHFRNTYFPGKCSINQTVLSKLASIAWKALPESEKLRFFETADVKKDDFFRRRAMLLGTPSQTTRRKKSPAGKKKTLSGEEGNEKPERRARSRAPVRKYKEDTTSKSPEVVFIHENVTTTPTLPSTTVTISDNTSGGNLLPSTTPMHAQLEPPLDVIDNCDPLVQLLPSAGPSEHGGQYLINGIYDQNQKLQQQHAQWAHFEAAYGFSFPNGKPDATQYEDFRNHIISDRPPNYDHDSEPFDLRELEPALMDGLTLTQQDFEWQQEYQDQNNQISDDDLWSGLIGVHNNLAATDADAGVDTTIAAHAATDGLLRGAQNGWMTFVGASLVAHEDVPSGMAYDFVKHDVQPDAGLNLAGDMDIDATAWAKEFPSGNDLSSAMTFSIPPGSESWGNM